MSEPEDAEHPEHLSAGATTVRNIEVEGGGVSVQTTSTSTEHADVRKSRLKREEESAKHRRWIEKAVFVIAGVSVAIVTVVCLIAVFHPEVSDSNREQAWRVIFLIIGALVGYLAGKASPSNSE